MGAFAILQRNGIGSITMKANSHDAEALYKWQREAAENCKRIIEETRQTISWMMKMKYKGR
ncbi:hypothetical protein AL497_24465 (plasmid) [Klebsiella aerogenes]|nr:hypothetical protein AL497_24465 [Klebsiella aerogenes]AVF02234.1 hypothetical protein AM441_27010 [Klebsiella aerogenes]KLF18818.1 hypothetical protein YA29_25075 [Klebsiella aerogenes]KZQ55186.1 hypothetical protein A3N61_19385 [Klebsiella aerogenes]RSW72862.1 hypothetical protein EGH63_25775 [Klebsiella aerogenes]